MRQSQGFHSSIQHGSEGKSGRFLRIVPCVSQTKIVPTRCLPRAHIEVESECLLHSLTKTRVRVITCCSRPRAMPYVCVGCANLTEYGHLELHLDLLDGWK